MTDIESYIQTLDKRRFKGNRISVHLRSNKYRQDLVLFGYTKGEDLPYCTMLCSPREDGSDLVYAEMSLPFLDELNDSYGEYEIVKNSPYVGKDYREVLEEFEERMHRLLEE